MESLGLAGFITAQFFNRKLSVPVAISSFHLEDVAARTCNQDISCPTSKWDHGKVSAKIMCQLPKFSLVASKTPIQRAAKSQERMGMMFLFGPNDSLQPEVLQSGSHWQIPSPSRVDHGFRCQSNIQPESWIVVVFGCTGCTNAKNQ